MKKRLLAILLTVCMVISMAPAAFAAGSVFTDVNADDWFAEEVEYVYDNGLMNGVGDNKFDPNGNVTRAMMWTTLARIAGENTTGSDPWWLAGQQWAMETGVSDGTMATDNITREQLVTMLYRYAQLKGYDVSVGENTNILSYTDAFGVNEWAVAAMQWACGAGIINGIDGALQPQGYATRAQLAAILYRFVEEVVNAAPATYTVTFMWNYGNKGVYETVQVEDGETVGSLRNPSRSGYTFSGWYTEDGDRFTLNTKVTEDIVVYAKWSEYVYIPVHTHSWTAGTPVAPTCTEQGYTPYTCACGASKNDDFVPAVSHVAGEKCQYCGVIEVETAEQLAAALCEDAANIHVVLLNDIEVPVADLSQWGQTPGSGEYKLGGDSTTAITIDLNEHKLTLTTGYMTAIGAKNEAATITIKNGSMNGTGNSATTWNINDLIFANCNYVFEDVTFDKEVALCNTGKTVTMTDVTIKGTGDYYALWIQAEGQTVEIDGLTVETTGRGIKIDEQYVSAENLAKVTLMVSDAKFTTAKKAAIMVKSAAGADIILSEVDISGVVADSVNAVWVDEDSAAYFGLVSVSGGSKALEGICKVNNADELKDAVADGKTNIWLNDGEYNVYGCGGKTLTISGSKDAVVKVMNEGEDGCDYAFGAAGTGVGNITFNGVTIDTTANTGNYKGFAYMKGTFNDCNFVGAYSLNNANDFVFNRCTFDFKNGYFWTWGAKSATFNNCIFNGNSKAILAHGWESTVITIKGCTFAATEKGYASGGTVWTAAIEIDPAGSNTYTINISDSTINENYAGWTRIKDGSTGHVIKIDGKLPVAEGLAIDPETGAYEISSAAGLFNFAKQVNEEGNNFSGKTVKLVSDIDLANATWTPIGQTGATEFRGVFDGQNYTISNLNVDSSAQTGEHYSSGLFGWSEAGAQIKNVKIEGATIKGNHNVAVIVGYTYSDKITNCHVTNAVVVCAHANNDACGDKAGIVGGYVGDEARVTDCSATDCTVTAGRDAGQLIGCGYNVSLSNCSADNVTVTAGGDCTGNNINEALIGRVMP